MPQIIPLIPHDVVIRPAITHHWASIEKAAPLSTLRAIPSPSGIDQCRTVTDERRKESQALATPTDRGSLRESSYKVAELGRVIRVQKLSSDPEKPRTAPQALI